MCDVFLVLCFQDLVARRWKSDMPKSTSALPTNPSSYGSQSELRGWASDSEEVFLSLPSRTRTMMKSTSLGGIPVSQSPSVHNVIPPMMPPRCHSSTSNPVFHLNPASSPSTSSSPEGWNLASVSLQQCKCCQISKISTSHLLKLPTQTAASLCLQKEHAYESFPVSMSGLDVSLELKWLLLVELIFLFAILVSSSSYYAKCTFIFRLALGISILSRLPSESLLTVFFTFLCILKLGSHPCTSIVFMCRSHDQPLWSVDQLSDWVDLIRDCHWASSRCNDNTHTVVRPYIYHQLHAMIIKEINSQSLSVRVCW